MLPPDGEGQHEPPPLGVGSLTHEPNTLREEGG